MVETPKCRLTPVYSQHIRTHDRISDVVNGNNNHDDAVVAIRIIISVAVEDVVEETGAVSMTCASALRLTAVVHD